MARMSFGSPLTAIVGAVFLLRAGRSTNEYGRWQSSSGNAQAQVALIEELLSVLPIGSGPGGAANEHAGSRLVLEKVIEDIQPTAAANNTALHFELQRL